MVDHDRPARRQLHGARIRRFDLVLDLKAREQRRVVAIAFDPGGMLRHHMRHELLGLVIDIVGVDQDVADVVVEVIANGADHQARFLVDQKGALASLGRAVDGVPKLEQVVQVPLKLGCATPYAGGARDHAHAVRVFELVQGFLKLGAVLAFDAPTDAAAARVVRHQHHIAPGHGDEGGQGRALVAAFFFFHLDQQLAAFADRILDARLAAAAEVLLRDFLERQETVAVFAIVHKAGLQ